MGHKLVDRIVLVSPHAVSNLADGNLDLPGSTICRRRHACAVVSLGARRSSIVDNWLLRRRFAFDSHVGGPLCKLVGTYIPLDGYGQG
jgi:hypothetical protein